MPKKSVEEKPSETAMFAALHRALAYKNYANIGFGPDNLAEYFLLPHFRFFLKFKKIRASIKNKLDRSLPGLHEYMIARTAWFDSLFMSALKNKIPQIVLLGAGYDSRAYRFADLNHATKIIDLDIATTQERKKKYLKRARIDLPTNVTLHALNFNTDSLGIGLERAGYDSHEQTLFLWEGVSYYLEPEAVDETLKFFSHSSHKKSLLAFDYMISISEENVDTFYGVNDFLKIMKKQHGEERLTFTIDDGQIESFLEQRGLKMIDHLDNKKIEGSFLFDTNKSLLGQITGHFRFVTATPKT